MKAIWSWLGLMGISILTTLPPELFYPQRSLVDPVMPIPTPPPLIPSPTPTPSPQTASAHAWYRAAWSAYTYAVPQGNQDQVLILEPDGQMAFAAGWEPGLPSHHLQRLIQVSLLTCTGSAEYRFSTAVYGVGSLERGTFRGDLWIVGNGDPYFTQQDGQSLIQELHFLGIRHLSGSLVVAGAFAMDGERDPLRAGQILHQLWHSQSAPGPLPWDNPQHSADPPATSFTVKVAAPDTPLPATAQRLLTHTSQPLEALIPLAFRDPAFVLPEPVELPETLDLLDVQQLVLHPQVHATLTAAVQPDPAFPLSLRVIQVGDLWVGRFADGRTMLWRTAASQEQISRFLRDIHQPGI